MPLLILIADDDPGVSLAVSDYLELQGYNTITAANGQAALELLTSHHPHLLISDIRMPGLDGYELVRQVRQQPQFRILPVIFLTERGSTAERVRGYQAGCDAYLPKPFEMVELGAVIRNLLERTQIIQSELHISQQNAERLAELSGELNLTEREQQVLETLVMRGLSNAEIGEHLHLSPRTIEKYISSLLRKTDTNNRAELVSFALKHGLVTP